MTPERLYDPKPRVAICHYWLVSSRGGEAVLEALLDIFPEADIFTHVLDESQVSRRISGRVKACSFIARLPFATRYYQLYLPLMPLASKLLDLSAYDLVISTESGPAKGVTTAPGALHICYCFSPMRYLWDQADIYLAGMGPVKALVFRALLPLLRSWDKRSARAPHSIIAISHFVAERVRQYWGREADIIFPPVDTGRFAPAQGCGESYLHLGQLVAYKRPDLLVDAFNDSGRRLLVAGDGELLPALRARARDNITFLGRVSDEEAVTLLQQCRALVFPGLEDFGIVPLEAMACGKPVIAYGAGGVLDTVVEGETGIFFHEPSAVALNHALEQFEDREGDFDSLLIAAHAQRFSRRRFVQEFSHYVNLQLQRRNSSRDSVAGGVRL